MTADSPTPLFGNVVDASKNTRGWFLGHFMPGENNPLRTGDVELKWHTHAKGERRDEWSPPSSVRTLNTSSGVISFWCFQIGKLLWRKKATSCSSVPASRTPFDRSKSRSS